ncbi:MAG: segregation/condensation protein A [Deltaproteobacteria bacterium]|nr:segregation/condensation protein A [Deltaproteobacteria bacterium]
MERDNEILSGEETPASGTGWGPSLAQHELRSTPTLPGSEHADRVASRPSLESGSAREGEGDFSVHLEFFSGPMDLLLHLVQQRELSIEEVNLVEVCRQYLDIVASAKWLDLERASEYLVIAATLTAIKSEAMLAGRVDPALAEIDESFDPAFFASLRERLKEYQLTKLRAQTLASRPQLSVTTFTRPTRAITVERPKDEDEVLEVGEASELGRMFVALLKRIGKKLGSYRISVEPVSVVSYMMKFVDFFRGRGEAPSGNQKFSDLLSSVVDRRSLANGEDGEWQRRSAVIGGFIALLELMKRGLVKASQDDDGSDIDIVSRLTGDGATEELTTEFDAPEVAESASRANVVALKQEPEAASASDHFEQETEFRRVRSGYSG